MIRVEKGGILVYRVFDVAEEIDLMRAESVLTQSASTSRLQIRRRTREELVIRNAPITITLNETNLETSHGTLRADTIARVWDYGVLSIMFYLPILPGTGHQQLVQTAAEIEDSEQIDTIARQRAEEVRTLLGPALKDMHNYPVAEDYVIFFLEKLSGIENAEELVHHADFDLAALLLAEPSRKLAQRNREAMMDVHHQYGADDLVVLDWNSAVVLEPSGRRDIPDVIEFALTHLMEMRYYDDLLDQRLGLLYDAIEERKAKVMGSLFSSLSHEAGEFYIEISEFLERVDNSLKVVGDSYYARIFREAARRFRLGDWEQSVTRKMNILATVSQILQGELNNRQSHILELVIICLIAFEILSAFWK